MAPTPSAAIASGLVAQLIQRGLTSPEDVSAYRHENGFEKLTLGVDPASGALLRAHFWGDVGLPTNEQAPPGNLHNHRWDFTSLILRGGLDIAKFAESALGDQYLHYRYWPELGDDLELIGPALLDQIAFDRYGEGSEYSEIASEIHLALPLESTVSLMVRSRSQRQHADVYSRKSRPDITETSELLPVERVLRLLEDLAKLVETHQSATA